MVWLVLAAFVALFAAYDLASGRWVAALVVLGVGAVVAGYGVWQRGR